MENRNLEKALEAGEDYRDYSGPIELSFKKGIVADNSGNKSDATVIKLDLNSEILNNNEEGSCSSLWLFVSAVRVSVQ